MATFEIINKSPAEDTTYYTIKVSFGEHEFEQTVMSSKTGKALTTFLQSYADDYETAYLGSQEP